MIERDDEKGKHLVLTVSKKLNACGVNVYSTAHTGLHKNTNKAIFSYGLCIKPHPPVHVGEIEDTHLQCT